MNKRIHDIGTRILIGLAALVFLAVAVWGIEGMSQTLFERYMPGYVDPERPPVVVEKTFSPAEVAAINEIHSSLNTAVSVAATGATINTLGSLDSRVVGYPGNRVAFDYVKSAFEDIGLADIRVDTIEVTVPIDQGAALTFDDTGDRLALHGLWPNRARTPTLPKGGVTGPLIYAGKGHWEDFDDKPVDGSIVLMDFDSVDRFVHARMLGAAAVIFFDNGVVTRGQAVEKILDIPINIPRFWASEEAAAALKTRAEAFPQVRLESRMTWETVETWNIYGAVYGSDEPYDGADEPMRRRDKTIVVQAHYDAISVVPAVAPGAENAGGIAGLLQVARAIKEYGPDYTFLFLATSAHFEGLTGISEFLYRHARTSETFLDMIPPEERIPIDLFVGLDLSGGGDQLTSLAFGSFDFSDDQQENAILKNIVPYGRRLESYAAKIFEADHTDRYTDGILPSDRSAFDLVPAFLALDHEAATRVGFSALSFVTVGDLRDLVDTPADKPDQVNIDFLTQQIRTAAGLLLAMARDPVAFEDADARRSDQGHDLKGRVVEWDRSVNFFTPKKQLPGALVTIPTDWGSDGGVRPFMVTRADENGEFYFRNLPSLRKFLVRSYVFDEDGAIIYAPDRGEEGAAMFPIDVGNRTSINGCVQVLFRCEAVDLLETIDPSVMMDLGALTVLTADNSSPRRYGFEFYDGLGGKAGMVYVEPGLRIKALASVGAARIQYLMTNTPEDMLLNPVPPAAISEDDRARAQGMGYPADIGYIKYPMYETARNLWVLDDIRLNGMIRHGVKNDRAQGLHTQAHAALMTARKALEEQKYSIFVSEARKAWGLEARAYPDVKATADDTVKAVIFYFILVLPFAYFMERLFFSFPDIRKQMAAFGGIFILVFLVLQRVHPAFKLSLTPYVIFLAFIILALGTIVILVLVSKFDAEMKKIKHRASGIHETDIGRVSATGVAVNLGMSNLRKRKLRSGLTAATLVLLTFTVLSFTSYSAKIQFYKMEQPNNPAYQGAMIRNPTWASMDPVLLDYVQNAFIKEARVVPRATWLSDLEDSRVDYEHADGSAQSYVTALMGLSHEEVHVTGIDRRLMPGSRWFAPGERGVCILPETVAARIGITPDQIGTAQIRMMGRLFRVIGMIGVEDLDALRDLDDERMTPTDFVIRNQQSSGEFRPLINISSGNHIDAHNTLITPYEYTKEIDGGLRSVALVPRSDDPAEIRQFYERIGQVLDREDDGFYTAIEDFLSRALLIIFVGQGDGVTLYRTFGLTTVAGLKSLFIPIAIAALLVLNTMMGAVHERFREISVYAAVGLAPSHIASLFLAEAAVFATIGVVVGYLLGQVTTMGLTSFGLLEGLSLNYSSMSAVTSSMIVLVVVILSAVYPAKKAADMSVQDVTRRWTLPKPDGEFWSFEFPFTVSQVEALALCTYLSRTFQAHEHGVAEGFVADGTQISAYDADGHDGYRLEASTWLAPFDLGVSQWTTLEIAPTGEDIGMCRIYIKLRYKSGDMNSWVNLNRAFLKILRKRFLVWRTMGHDIKTEYAEEGRRLIGPVNQT